MLVPQGPSILTLDPRRRQPVYLAPLAVTVHRQAKALALHVAWVPSTLVVDRPRRQSASLAWKIPTIIGRDRHSVSLVPSAASHPIQGLLP